MPLVGTFNKALENPFSGRLAHMAGTLVLSAESLAGAVRLEPGALVPLNLYFYMSFSGFSTAW